MRDRHGAHRKRGNVSDQLDLFARAESSVPEDTPTWCTLPGRTRRKATIVSRSVVYASGPDTPEGDDRVPIGGVKIFIMVMGGLRLV